jgi:hypothetical protein
MRSLIYCLSIVSVLSSCHFYQSEVPITTAEKSTIDPKFLGEWHTIEYNEETEEPQPSPDKIRVLNFNNKEYAAMLVDAGKVSLLKMHSSVINNKTIFNIFPIEDIDNQGEPKYFFFVLDAVNGDSISLRYITDSIKLQFKTPKALEQYLKKNFKQLESEWLSEPFSYYHHSYFIWDRVNKLKISELDSVWKIEARVASAETSVEEMLRMPKKLLNVETCRSFFAGAYQIEDDLSQTLDAAQQLVLKFKNGTYHRVWMEADGSTIVNYSQKKSYKTKGGWN